MAYKVNEIFYTLQGEGAHMGIPAVFVRFSGCNLRCPWCDTEFSESTPMSAEEIVAEVQDLYDIPNERRKMRQDSISASRRMARIPYPMASIGSPVVLKRALSWR